MHKSIQIVDESGCYLGSAISPEEAIIKNQIRLASRVIIENGHGEYLLQKRADGMFVYPGCWDCSAAGHVDEGETPEQAAYRELVEEIGIDEIELKLVSSHYTKHRENHGYISRTYSHVFAGVFTGDIASLKLEPTEVSEVKWFSKNEIRKLIRLPGQVTDGLQYIFEEVL